MTSANPATASASCLPEQFRRLVDAYDIAHLVRHLDEAGSAAELHKLLAAEYGGNSNFWFAIKDAADDAVGYLDDLRIAWKNAAAEIRSGAGAAAGTELLCSYALMLASLRGRDACLPPEFVLRLLQTGVWSWKRTLAYLQAAEDPVRRIEATALVLPEADATLHEQLFSGAVAELDRLARMYGHFDYPTQRVRNLIRLFRALPEPVLGYAFDAMLQELARQQEPDNVADLIEALVPHVTAHHLPLLDSYLRKTVEKGAGNSLREAIEFINRRYRRLELLARLCTHRRGPERDSVCRQILREVAWLFDGLKAGEVQHVGARRLMRCLRALTEYSGESIYQGVVDGLHADLVANETFDLAFSAELLPFLAPGRQQQEAERFSSRLTSAHSGTDALDAAFTGIGEWPDSLKSVLLRQVFAVLPVEQRLRLLSRLAGLLPTPLAQTAATAAVACLRQLGNTGPGYGDPRVLAQLCPFISPADRHYLLERISSTRTLHWRFDAIAEWLVLCPVEHERTAVFDQALREARADSEGYNGESLQRRFLRKAAPAVSAAQARAELDGAAAANDGKDFLFAIGCILPLLPEEERGASIRWALGLMRAAQPWGAARSLCYIAEHINTENIAEALDFAGSLADEAIRAHALAGLLQIPALDDETSGALWRSVLDACDLVQDPAQRARVYAAIPRGRLDPERLQVLRGRFLATFQNVDYPSVRTEVLASMESLLPDAQFDALMLEAIRKSRARDASVLRDAVRNAAAKLPERLLDEVWEMLRHQDVNDVDDALEALASRFAQCGRIAQALSVTRHLCEADEAVGSGAIAAIAAVLEAADVLRLAAQVEGFRHHFRDQALSTLAIRLAQCGERVRALQLIDQIKEPEYAVPARCGAAMYLAEAEGGVLLAPVPALLGGLTGPLQVNALHKVVPALLQYHRRRDELLIELLQVVANNRRADLVPILYALAPVLHAVGGKAMLARLMRAIRTVGRWWP